MLPPPAQSAVKVQPHPQKRRALYAATQFQPGDVILAVEPLLLLPSRALLTTICSHCFRPGIPRACSRCRAAYYCDSTCQAAAWSSVHSRECKALRQIADETRRRELPTPVRALIQTLLNADIQAGILPLEGHLQLRSTDPEWDNVQLMATGASAYAGKGTTPGAIQKASELLSKIEMNAFQRSDNEVGLSGLFLEPTLAMANHSCVPNALVQFNGRKAFLRAGQLIRAGDEIEIAYTAFTDPLPQRKRALSLYKFECRCARCQGDLNVYQVAAAFPNLDLNVSGLVTDLSKFRQHPVLSNIDKQSIAQRYCKATDVTGSALVSESPSLLRKALQEQYQASAHLVKEDLWAVSPLPDTLTGISVYYLKAGNAQFALATACFFATACDPYRFAQPFHFMRLYGLLAIAKLLSNTAADTASLTDSLKSMAAKASLSLKIQEALGDIDQVSLCQMLLIMILSWTPKECLTDWELSVQAQDMLDDIDQLAGREKELSLINEWKRNPNSDQSKAFFDYAVVQRVQTLADLGRAVLKQDFGA